MSQARGTMFKQREIVLVPFPYSDYSAIKKRPVLIISNDDYNQRFQDVIVCVITSNRYIDDSSIELSDRDIEYGLLPEKSVIKAHKLFTVQQDRILKKFSSINAGLFEGVVLQINKVIRVKTDK